MPLWTALAKLYTGRIGNAGYGVKRDVWGPLPRKFETIAESGILGCEACRICLPLGVLRAAGRKSNWLMKQILRWFMLYFSVAFIMLIPIMCYLIVAQGTPKIILLIVIPFYLLMSVGFYKAFKAMKPK
jgi:hypothetical protein